MGDLRQGKRLQVCQVTAAGVRRTTIQAAARVLYEKVREAGWTRTPDPRDAPNEASLRFRMGETDCLFNVYQGILLFYYSGRFSTDPSAAEGIKAAAAVALDDQFGILEDALDPGPYLLGETFSAVDILLWMLIQWHPAPARLFEKAPRVEQIAELLHARPAIARTWLEHEEAD